jgi:hypothetical protein
MLFQLLSWLIRSSEVVTNSLDLFAFILATPEIIGRERVVEIHDRLERLRANPRFAIPLIILIWIALVFCSLMAFYLVFTSPIYLIVLMVGEDFADKHLWIVGVVSLVWVFILFPFGLFLVVMAFPNLFSSGPESSHLYRRLYRTARYLVVNSPVLLTPRGMLFTALGLFLFSRLLSIAHALAAG